MWSWMKLLFTVWVCQSGTTIYQQQEIMADDEDVGVQVEEN